MGTEALHTYTPCTFTNHLLTMCMCAYVDVRASPPSPPSLFPPATRHGLPGAPLAPPWGPPFPPIPSLLVVLLRCFASRLPLPPVALGPHRCLRTLAVMLPRLPWPCRDFGLVALALKPCCLYHFGCMCTEEVAFAVVSYLHASSCRGRLRSIVFR